MISEGKQVGVLYHFTTPQALNKLLDASYQKELHDKGDVLTFVSMFGHLSTTRNYQLSTDPEQVLKDGDLSIKRGFCVRIAFDGDRISDKFKVRPVLGLVTQHKDVFNPPETHKERVSRKEQEREEIISNKSGVFDLSKYILSIDVYGYTPEIVEWYKQVKPKIEALGIRTEMRKKWSIVKEDVLTFKEFLAYNITES
jgi:hypothetical protein